MSRPVSAFPVPASTFVHPQDVNRQQQYVPAQDGMTLRDYFAAKAAQALLHPELMEAARMHVRPGEQSAFIAKAAYEIADAMLAERSK